MFPDKATLFISGMEDEEFRASKIDFWDDVYGISMKSIKEVALREPLIDLIDPDCLVTNIWPVYQLDLQIATIDDTEFVSSYALTAERA